MARHARGEESQGREHHRRQFIDALLHHRGPPPVDEQHLLRRIEGKTAQHRSPFSANISRKHATILASLSPPGSSQPKIVPTRSLTPSRESSRRQAFEVFEWEHDREPLEPLRSDELRLEVPREDAFPSVSEAPPALSREMEGRERWQAAPDEEGEVPEEVPEAPDDWEMDLDAALEASMEPSKTSEEREGAGERSGEEEAPTPSPPPPPAEEEEDMVVEGRPGQQPTEGGQFPTDLLEPLDEAETDSVARPDMPRKDREDEPRVFYEPERDMEDEGEVDTGETETEEGLMGIAHSRRWPSDTGLEVHIDGFEHMAATSDLCPRCGRRISARNRLLTCNDCGTVACEQCEIRTAAKVDSPYYYDWRFDLPLCVNCYDKALNIQKALAKAKAALGMGNHTYAFYHAQQALRTDPTSPYAEEAQRIISQVDHRRREAAEQDEAWKRQRSKLSRTTVVKDD